jgi:hypothetical protein
MSSSQLAYGFIPPSLVEGLKDAGDWRVRAGAIEDLQSLVQSLSNAEPLVPHLSGLMTFMTGLLDDPNFKISLTTLQILGELVGKLDKAFRPVCVTTLRALIEKLGDNKIVIRQANLKVIARMMQTLTPGPFVPVLLQSLDHKNWHVREELAGLVILALLTYRRFEFDYPSLARDLSLALSDPKPRIQFVAAQGLAVVQHLVGANALHNLLEDLLEPGEVPRVLERIHAVPMPTLTADGLVDHHHPQGFGDDGSSSSLPPSAPSSQQLGQPQYGGYDLGGEEGRLTSAGRAQSRGGTAGKKFPWEKPARATSAASTGGGGGGSVPTGRRVGFHDTVFDDQATPDGGNYDGVPAPLTTNARTPRELQSGPNAAPLWINNDNSSGAANQPKPFLRAGSSSDQLRASGSNSSSSSTKVNLWLTADQQQQQQQQQQPLHVTRSMDETALDEAEARRVTFDADATFSRSMERTSSSEIAGKLQQLKSRRGSRQGLMSPSSASSYSPSLASAGDPSMLDSGNNTSSGGGGAGNNSSTLFNDPEDRPIRRATSASTSSFDPSAYDNAYPDGVAPPFDDDYSAAPASSSSSAAAARRSARPQPLSRRKAASATASGPAGASTGSLASGGGGSSGGLKSPAARQATAGQRSTEKTGAFDDVLTEDIEPSENPDREFRQAMDFIQSDDWEKNMHALLSIRRMAVHHPDLLSDKERLHTVSVRLMEAVDNLRSAVSKNAVISFRDLFNQLEKLMDPELDKVLPFLIKKVVGSGFIAEEIETAVDAAIARCTMQRVLSALILSYQHKNPMVRAHTAMLIERGLEAWSSRIRGAAREMERLLPTAGAMLDEGAIETRNYGKRVCYHLYSALGAQDFERRVRSTAADAAAKRIMTVVEKQDWGRSTLTVGSGRARATTSSRSASSSSALAATSAPSGASLLDDAAGGVPLQLRSPAGSAPGGASRSAARKPSAGVTPAGAAGRPRALPADFENLPSILSDLDSSDWRLRHDGVEKLLDLLGKYPEEAAPKLVTVFDKFNKVLNDSNSKVNAFAMQTLGDLVPKLGDSLVPVLPNLVPVLASTLASMNAGIRDQTSIVFDLLIRCVDLPQLISSVTNVTLHGNLRVRPVLLTKLADMVEPLWQQKPALVTKYLLPVALKNLSDSKIEIRSANGHLLQVLYRFMGDTVLEHASQLPQSDQQRLREIVL